MSQNPPITNPVTFRNISTRSWLEHNVRPWLLIAGVMTIAVVALAIYQISALMEERWLVLNGTPVSAKVITIGLAKDRRVPRNEVTLVHLQYIEPKSGTTYESDGYLPRKQSSMVSIDDILTIRVDPNHPNRWTERSVPTPILLELTVPLMLSPIVLIALYVAWRQRSKVVKAVRAGNIARASVLSVRQTPIAPMSKLIGIALESGDRRVREVYWPTKNGAIAKGDTIDVIVGTPAPLVPTKSYM